MFSETSYHVWRSMAFKPNDQSYGHIHGIVCSNDLILCTKGASWDSKQCCLREFSLSLHKKSHFPFFECPKWGFFVKDLPNNYCKIGPNHFSKILGHIKCTIDQMVWCKMFLIHLRWKRQIPADSVGSGSNLNCSCLIVCSLFFPKIISRYISIYLIIETSKVFQDSTTS